MTTTTITETTITETTIASIAAAGGGARMTTTQGLYAHAHAERAIGALMPAGLYSWLVRPRAGETARAYARRAVRYAIARCAEAGVATPLAHAGSETLAMHAAHGRRGRSGSLLVDRLERGASIDGE